MSDPTAKLVRVPPDRGTHLLERDYSSLLDSWITREFADAAILRRVNEQEGREIVCQKGTLDCSGLLIPYYWPGTNLPVSYRIRRDHPDIVNGKNGAIKLDRKYLGAPGERNRLYIPPAITLEQLADPRIPIVIVEGVKKALAVRRLADHETSEPDLFPLRSRVSGIGGARSARQVDPMASGWT